MSAARQARRLLAQAIEVRHACRPSGVFVLCAPRSGGPQLARALAASPGFHAGGESNFFFALAGLDREGHGVLREAHRRDRAKAAGTEGFEEFLRHFGPGLEHLFKSRADERRWLDPAPENVLVAEQLAVLFPRAQFLHVVRDGRAVARSARLADVGWGRDAAEAATLWLHHADKGLAFEKRYPKRVLRVGVEELMADLAAGMARIQAFLRADADDAPMRLLQREGLCQDFDEVAVDADGQATAFDVPLDGGWAAWSRAERTAFARIAHPPMRALGYWRSAPRFTSP